MSAIPKYLHKQPCGEKYAIISDRNVATIYGKKLSESLTKAGIKNHLISFQAGEKNKNIKTVMKMMDQMLKYNFSRSDAIIALGGGVTGDMAGFIASIYMRGIPYLQAPTSLLAMVDSSIGGKTGINLTAGKNLAGIFYQPKVVLIDPTLLKTLPKDELLNGFAEIIKYSVITKSGLLSLLKRSAKKAEKMDFQLVNKLITQCCKIKASIIEKDEKEKNKRMSLNYGHTIGHAIEKDSGYRMSHGRAIALGMVAINRIAVKKGILEENNELRIQNLIKSFGFTDDFFQKYEQEKSLMRLWKLMQNDKKLHKSKIRFITLVSIGKWGIYDQISKNDFITLLKKSDA